MWVLLEYSPFFGGAYIAGLNFYLSFLRFPLARWRGKDVRFVSGLPLVGSVVLGCFAAWHYDEAGWFWASVALLLLDTGGMAWLVIMIVWVEGIRPRRSKARAEPFAAPAGDEVR